ncbi:MAG: CHAT domain-containing protein [Bacteroidales bacterium]|nr:CHAT domain-containing protein [Bacteroidales bacterium]MBN2819663.1 CHAT domain-containing protein [Bacteroidales bacterium]
MKGSEDFYNADFESAINNFKKALDIRVKLYGERDERVAHSLNNIGVAKMHIWQYSEALLYLNRAKNIYQLNNNEIDILNTLSNIGSVYKNQGDLNLASQYLNYSIESLPDIETDELLSIKCGILNRFGQIELIKKQYANSIKYFQEAIKLGENIVSPSTYHYYLTNISIAYMQLGKYDHAFYYLKKSLKSETNSSNKIISYEKLVDYYISKNDQNNAFKYIQSIEDILNKSSIDSIYYLNLYNNYSKYYSYKESYAQEFIYYQKSLSFLTKQPLDFTLKTPESGYYINQIDAINVLKNKSECLINWYKQENNCDFLSAAIEAASVATDLINIARNSYLSYESKLAIAENESSIYQLGLQASYYKYNSTGSRESLEDAFYFAERSKSSILEANLNEEKAKLLAGIPEKILDFEVSLVRDITLYKSFIYHENLKPDADSTKLHTWNKYLLNASLEYDSLISLIEKKYPKYHQLKYDQSYSSINDIQNKLDKKTSLIEYTITDSALFVFRINQNSAELYIKNYSNEEQQLLRQFLSNFKSFSYFDQSKNIYKDYEDLGYSIYCLLFEDVADKLKYNLVIIPDKILSYLPFEALVYKESDKLPQAYRDIHYLMNNYSIAYSYSAHLYLETLDLRKRSLWNNTLVFAPSYDNNSLGLSYLPFALEEADEISGITIGKTRIKNDATASQFLKLSPRYALLHLAMHTIIDDNNPLYSKLVFYGDSNNYVTTSDIFSLKLNARMAVLSACSTGEGEYKSGEGVLSLARSFFYSGCPSLTMTLWNVDDKSGLQLMKHYYKYLKRGYSKPKALLKSKIDYIKSVPEEKQHPYFWANYISIGNASAIFYPKWQLLLITGSILIITVILISKYSKNKNKMKLTEPSPDNPDHS